MVKKSILISILFILIVSIVVYADDTDGDGVDDLWEFEHFSDLLETGDADADGDGLTNRQEYEIKSNPKDADSDDDGFSDGEEVRRGTNPVVEFDKPVSYTIHLISLFVLLFATIGFYLMHKKGLRVINEDPIEVYIKDCEREGYTDNAIKQKLKQSGYSDKKISQYLK